jgi:polyhydroxybutyrate depolymerase
MRIFTTLFLCLVFAALARAQGDTISQTFVHNDSLRSYLLYVPEAYDGTEDWPLVINYHGFNINAGTQMELSQMNAVADTAHFLIAYPQGLQVFSPVLNASAPGWNPINGLLSNTDDISFSNQLISEINSMYQVDQARIYTTGWSMGATMAWQTACALPDRVAAVAAVSQQMADLQIADCNPGRAFPTLLIHGTGDSIALFNGDGGFFSASPLTPRFWADYNNCVADSMVTVLPDLITSDSSTVTLIQL